MNPPGAIPSKAEIARGYAQRLWSPWMLNVWVQESLRA